MSDREDGVDYEDVDGNGSEHSEDEGENGTNNRLRRLIGTFVSAGEKNILVHPKYYGKASMMF